MTSARRWPRERRGRGSCGRSIWPARSTAPSTGWGRRRPLLAVAAGMLGGGANIHQAAYTALAASVLVSRQMGQQPLDGHTLREVLESRPELAE